MSIDVVLQTLHMCDGCFNVVELDVQWSVVFVYLIHMIIVVIDR